VVAAVALSAVPAAAMPAPPGGPVQPVAGNHTGRPTLRVAFSSRRAGARPVAVTLSLFVPLQCNSPGTETLRVRLPARERVPRTIAPSAVLVDGRPAARVRVSGRVLSIDPAPPAPHHVLCDIVAVGRVEVRLTEAAGLGNPAHAGSYRVVARRGQELLAATFTLTG
jgi:hypothetical protein